MRDDIDPLLILMLSYLNQMIYEALYKVWSCKGECMINTTFRLITQHPLKITPRPLKPRFLFSHLHLLMIIKKLCVFLSLLNQ